MSADDKDELMRKFEAAISGMELSDLYRRAGNLTLLAGAGSRWRCYCTFVLYSRPRGRGASDVEGRQRSRYSCLARATASTLTRAVTTNRTTPQVTPPG